MKLRELAETYNTKKDYFSVMKCTAKSKYDYIFGFDKDLLESTIKFNKYIDNLFYEVEEITRSFKTPYKLSQWLFEKKIYGYSYMGSQCLDTIMYARPNTNFSLRMTVINKLLRIKKAYENEI